MTTDTQPLTRSALSDLNAVLKRRLANNEPRHAKDIVDELAAVGISLNADGDNIRIVKGKPTPEQRQLIKDHKPAIHDYLTGFGMRFDFWVPEEVEAIVACLLIRVNHCQWPDDDESFKVFGHMQDEIDAAYHERNLERLKRAETRLHDWLDRQPYAMKGPALDGHGQVSWYYEPVEGTGLDGMVKAAKWKTWRRVACGVFNEDRANLDGYLSEFAEHGFEVKVVETDVPMKRVR